MTCRCPKCGKEFSRDKLNELWNKGKGPEEVICDNPSGAVIGGFFGALLGGIIAGPIGAIAGLITGASMFSKEKRRRPE